MLPVRSASLAHMWSACAGWAHLKFAAGKTEPGEHLIAGRRRHWGGQLRLEGKELPESHPDYGPLTETDLDVIDHYYAYVERLLGQIAPNGCNMVKVEWAVPSPVFGECIMDLVAVVPELVAICDLKAGYSHYSAEMNPQMIIYGGVVARALNLAPDFPMELHIVQPLCYREQASVWKTDVATVVSACRALAAIAMSDAKDYTPGTHCAKCDYLLECPARRSVCAAIFDVPDRAFRIEDIPDIDLGLEYENAKALKKMLENLEDSLKAELLQRTKSGRPTRWHLDQRSGGTKFRDGVDPDLIIATASQFNVDARKPQDLKTATQIINSAKAADRGLLKDALSLYTREVTYDELKPGVNDKFGRIFRGE